jgi:serine/threonine protein kinase
MYVLIMVNSKKVNATDNDYNEKLFQFFKKQATINVASWEKNKPYQCEIDGKNTTFRFNYDIVRRDRKETKSKNGHDNDRYEVISNNDPIGQGGYGIVKDIDSTFYFKTSGSKVLLNEKTQGKDGRRRVVKIQHHHLFKNPVSLVKSEYDNSKKVPSLAIKNPTLITNTNDGMFTNSYMVMNKLPGHDLSYILYTQKLSITQKIELTQALLCALDKLTRQGIIHQDIKPENIKVDLTKTPIDVTIFDFGLSIDGTKKLDGYPGGTFGYLSPEMFNKLRKKNDKPSPKIDYKTDVYSLAHVIAQVWNSKRECYGKKDKITIPFEQIKPSLFKDITDLDDSQKKVIEDTIKGMLKINPEERLSISDAIKKFSAVKKSKSVFSSLQSFFVASKTTLRHPVVVSPKKITYFTDDKIKAIEDMVKKLQKEIESIWPYPNKDKKEIKKCRLKELLMMTDDNKIKKTIKQMKEDPSITGGKFSTRTADLLDSLLPEEKNDITYK